MLRQLFNRSDDNSKDREIEYALIRESPEPREKMQTFATPVDPEYVEIELGVSEGVYRLQEVDTERKTFHDVLWREEFQAGELDRLEEQVEQLRAEIAADREADEQPLEFPTDRDELEGELLGHLAMEHGPETALDRLEALEAARSGDGLLQSVEDPTNHQEVLGRVLVDAYDQYGDDVSEILDNLGALTGGGQESVDPAALQQAIDQEANRLDLSSSAGASPARTFDDNGQEAAADGGAPESAAKRAFLEAEEDVEKEDVDDGDDGADENGGDGE